MNLQLARRVVAVSLFTAGAGIVGQACSSSLAGAQTPSTPDPVVGVWNSQVTITDCHGTTTRQFQARNIFHEGGTLTDTDSQPPSSHGPASGTWQSQGGGMYTSVFELYRFNADGTLAGSNHVQRTLTLGADNNSFTTTFTVAVNDPTGTNLMNGCGTETAARLN
jgi:hypothetical protein